MLNIRQVIESRLLALTHVLEDATENKTLEYHEMDNFLGRIQELQFILRLINGHQISSKIEDMINDKE